MSYVCLFRFSTKWGACLRSICLSYGFAIIAFGCKLVNQLLLGWLQLRDLVAEFSNFFLLPTFLVFVWFLLTLSFFPACKNIVVAGGNCWTHPLLIRIGSGEEHTIRQTCSLCRAWWCIAVIVSSRLEFRYSSRCKGCCFDNWDLGGNFLQNLGVFLAVAAIIDFDWSHNHCQFCIVQFLLQQV